MHVLKSYVFILIYEFKLLFIYFSTPKLLLFFIY